MPDTRTPPTGNNIIEARRIRLAPRSGSAMLEVDLEVLPGQLHLIYSDDPDSSRAISDVLLGLCDAAQGEVRLHGRAWAEIPPRDAYRLRSSIGRVASKGNWMDTRPVMENILLPLRHHTVLPDELLHEMACDFAQRFGLPGLPTLLPGQCPEPDLQRAACVRAFMGRPELVILEHPLEFADTGLLPPLVDAVQQVRRRQGSVIWFTRRRAVLEDHGIPADRRYRIAGRQLLELETSA